MRCILLVITTLCLVLLPACKASKSERLQPEKTHSDLEKASQVIAQIHTESPQNADIIPNIPPHLDQKIIDLSKLRETETEETAPKTFDATQRELLSQYPSDDQRFTIRTHFIIRGIPKSKLDGFEERLWNLLHTHTPHPWELKKPNQLDKHDTVWGRLEIQFKKQTNKLKRASKTAPLRAEYQYVLSMKFYGPQNTSIAWDNWQFQWQDEVPVSNESNTDAQFWQNLSQAFPTFTAIQPEQTAQWMRSQGLMPQILSDGLKLQPTGVHQYYPQGCILSRNTGSDTKYTYHLQQLQALYTPPQGLTLPQIATIHCSREATYLVSAETPVKMALYYQPKRAVHAWKSQLTFQDAMSPEDIHLHLEDTLICLYTANRTQTQRGFEIQCLDRKTGLMKWQTKRLSGGLRGFASTPEKLAFVTDHALFEIHHSGEVLRYTPIETSSRLRKRHSCQLQNRLIFMPGPGQFASWNLEKSEFDWQINVIESDFIHCGQQNTFIFSEVGGYLLAYDVENQTPLWKYRAVSMPRDAWSYADDIYLLFDRAIIILDRPTGHKKAQIPLPWLATHFIQHGHNLYLDTADAIYRWR